MIPDILRCLSYFLQFFLGKKKVKVSVLFQMERQRVQASVEGTCSLLVCILFDKFALSIRIERTPTKVSVIRLNEFDECD